MNVLIVHQFGKKAQILQKRLKYENVNSQLLFFETKEKVFEKLIGANALIIYIESPKNNACLSILPELSAKLHLSIIVIDEKENLETDKFCRIHAADFYISPPFSFPEIAMKLKYLVYQKDRFNGEQILTCKDIVLDFINHIVKCNNKNLLLRNKEFALLEFFMLNQGKILTRNTILEHVWDRNTSLFSNTVDVHVARLRKKLEGNGNKEKFIHTVYCIGYKFEPAS